MSTVGETVAPSDEFSRLLLESGLVTSAQYQRALDATSGTSAHIDEALMVLGLLDRDRLLRVTSLAWNLPSVDLGVEWIDHDLVRQWSGEIYLENNWMPVRDQANGSVLIATARDPRGEHAAEVARIVDCPVEFAVSTSADIAAAVLASFTQRGSRGMLSRALWRMLPST